MKRRLLIAEDSQQTRDGLAKLLRAEGFEVDTVGDGKSALKMLTESSYGIFLTDLRMPGLDGMKLIAEIQGRKLPTTAIVMTGYGSISEAVKATQLGAYDFLTKPVDPDHLKLVLERVGRERGLVEEVARLREQMRHGTTDFQGILTKSPRMHAILELIRNVAATSTTVLIEGETGTGKEMVARAIHLASSSLRAGPLVAVNCAALPENLLESELFGHEKGSFTNAVGQRKGRFEMANGGTLFLDEVGDVPASMQVKLLRVLQERRFERVGGSDSIEVDVRVVAATNRSLTRLVKRGKFREDLYYRLNVVKIDLPPMRERMEDVPLLAAHFAAKYARPGASAKEITPEAMDKLLKHTWPGNVRELENALERACVTATGPSIGPGDLPLEVLQPRPATPARTIDLTRPLPDVVREATVELEKQYLQKALKKTRGNIGRCARLCGLSRRSISAKLAEYSIDKDAFKSTEE